MLIRLLAGTLILIGAAGFFMPYLIGTVIKDSATRELPLSEISDVAVSADGDLYFALMFTGRIQQYTRDGKFVQSFPVNSHLGLICDEIVRDRLLVYAARRDASDEFDLSGRPTRLNAPDTQPTNGAGCIFDSRVRSVDWSLDAVRVTFSDGRPAVTIARQPWHYLALHVFLSWFIAVVGMVLFPEWRRGIVRQMQRRRARKEQ